MGARDFSVGFEISILKRNYYWLNGNDWLTGNFELLILGLA
jgi:hypothetical protein